MPEDLRPQYRALGELRRFSQVQRQGDRCEVCGALIPPEHRHLLELKTRKLQCSCRPCALLFEAANPSFRLVPQPAYYLPDFRMTDAQWGRFMLPIDLAFFVEPPERGRVHAYYPSPAGATESVLTLEAWGELVVENPVLRQLAPSVEALLVERTGGRRDYFRVPIDQCFRLVGLLRTHWQGLSGGPHVWREVEGFFSALKARSAERREVSHA